MVLRFTNDEVELVREALTAYAAALAARARACGPGYSSEGVDLCCKRLTTEILCENLLNRQPRLTLVPKQAAAVTYSPALPSSRMCQTS